MSEELTSKLCKGKPKDLFSLLGKGFGKVADLGSRCVCMTVAPNIVPYILPSLARAAIKEKKKEVESEKKQKAWPEYQENMFTGEPIKTSSALTSMLVGGVTGACLLIAQLQIYKENPKYLIIPLITNAISGFYEIIRSKKK